MTNNLVPTKKIKYWNEIANSVANASHDIHTKVGSLLINNTTLSITSTGYNGFIQGAKDDALPKTRPEKYLYMIHSEINLLTNCCKNGISTNNCFIYCTLSPCINCARTLWQAGIREVYFRDMYKDFKDSCNMLDLDIQWFKRDDGFYYLKLDTK